MIFEEEPLGRQAQKAKNTREKIIAAAIALIKEGGISNASSGNIAQRAGTTWGAAQHHFGSKEEILDAIMDISHANFSALMADPAMLTGALADRVELFVERMWQHYQSDVYLAALEILMAARGGPENTPVHVDRTAGARPSANAAQYLFRLCACRSADAGKSRIRPLFFNRPYH
jgi:AcrR family transcriptional regulator